MIRNLLIFILALAATVGSLVAAVATDRDQREALRGYVDPLRDSDLPYRVPRLGVNAELRQYTPQELADNLDLMQTAHIHWVRQIVPWDVVEAERGQYDWSAWDVIVSAFSERADIHASAGGDLTRAIADFDEAIALGRGDANTYLRRGSAHQRKGDKEAVIADFRKVLALEPNNPVARLNLMHLGAPAPAQPKPPEAKP